MQKSTIFLFIIITKRGNYGKKIVITSGKGGVGKTTITAELALKFSELGLRVAVIDTDFGLNNLDVVLGLEDKVVYDISDVFDGRCRVKQALVQDNGHKNLYLLSSNNTYGSEISGQKLKYMIENLAPTFDYILFDSPAGIDAGFERAVACADQAIVVTTTNMSCIRDADKVISLLKSYRLENISVVVNKVRGDLILDNLSLDVATVESVLKTKVIGVIPESDEVLLSSGNGVPSKSRAGKAFKILANNIEKSTYKLYDPTRRYTGLFGSIKRSLKRSV